MGDQVTMGVGWILLPRTGFSVRALVSTEMILWVPHKTVIFRPMNDYQNIKDIAS
jgi:hypothetical protein